ncbi:MAG: ABC transporter ATP-binding protein [Lentisphaeria bacterium]|nr:ABC transporter ATP-binding protein [Lentisphaeria bacterium]
MKLEETTAQKSFAYSWLIKRMYPFVKPYIPRIIIGFLIALPLGLLDGVTAFVLKPYMDYVISGNDLAFTFLGIDFSFTSLQLAFIIPFCVVAFTAFQGLLQYINQYICIWTSQRITNDIKMALFENLIGMHPKFFDENSSGVIISRYMNDPVTASTSFVDQLKTIVTTACSAVGLIAVMLYSSWQLAIVGVLVLVCAFLPASLLRKRIKRASNQNMVIGGQLTTNVNETYSGNKVMAAYNLQQRQNKLFKKLTWDAFHVNISLSKRLIWLSPVMHLISSVGVAIILGFGTYLINNGTLTSGGFASFLASLLLLYKPIKSLSHAITNIQTTFVALSRVLELFDCRSEISEAASPVEMTGLKEAVTFENLCFEYEDGNEVLHNIDLRVAKNETLAIVGNSGGGKSTLVNLLPRFYDIKSGALKFDGVDVRDISLRSLRDNIAIVFQDNFLFSGTIRENIMMGKPEATGEELAAAVKSAHLTDTLAALPDGLDTELGERGITLSGGQRQRVAIARAILKNAPVIILDEATSALDNESEAVVQKAMDNLMKDRTVFIIAHRLSTIRNADRIAVINDGSLVELGTHDELLAIENGQYKELYELSYRQQRQNQ